MNPKEIYFNFICISIRNGKSKLKFLYFEGAMYSGNWKMAQSVSSGTSSRRHARDQDAASITSRIADVSEWEANEVNEITLFYNRCMTNKNLFSMILFVLFKKNCHFFYFH